MNMHSQTLQQIHDEHKSLTEEQKTHVKQCSECKKELAVMISIEKSVRSFPMRAIPEAFRQRLVDHVLRPSYRIWQLVLSLGLVMLTPVLINHYLLGSNGWQALHYTIAISSGVLAFLILIPLTYILFENYYTRIVSMQERVDSFLDHSIEKLPGRH